jgi:hypothetical protein
MSRYGRLPPSCLPPFVLFGAGRQKHGRHECTKNLVTSISTQTDLPLNSTLLPFPSMAIPNLRSHLPSSVGVPAQAIVPYLHCYGCGQVPEAPLLTGCIRLNLDLQRRTLLLTSSVLEVAESSILYFVFPLVAPPFSIPLPRTSDSATSHDLCSCTSSNHKSLYLIHVSFLEAEGHES